DPALALLSDEGRLTWSDLVEAASRRAHLALDRRRTDRPFHIGVLLDNCFEFVEWIAAASLGGATVVGINATRRGAELARDIRHTDCQFLVTDRSHASLIEGLDLGIPHE